MKCLWRHGLIYFAFQWVYFLHAFLRISLQPFLLEKLKLKEKEKCMSAFQNGQ